MELRLLSGNDVAKALPMVEAIEGVKQAYAQLSAGRAVMPLRTKLQSSASGTTLMMPAFLPEPEALAVKVVSVFPQNLERSLPTIHAVVLAIEASTGKPLALIEGEKLTAIRTGAAAGAATDLLARKDASIAAIFGSSVQARTQLEAICTVRAIDEVRVFSLDQQQAAEFAAEMAGKGPVPTSITVSTDAASAIQGADIICTATTSSTPVFDGRLLKPGVHINGVGSFTPEMQEIDSITVQRALLVVDQRSAVLSEAGDILIPLKNGEISEDHIYAELGEIVSKQKAGRENDQQITFFKSVGVAVQDAVAAAIILRNAAAQNLGSLVSL